MLRGVVTLVALAGWLAFLPAAGMAGAPAAQDKVAAAAAPGRDSLVEAWEKNLRADAHVSRLEKTKEKDVYGFTTDFFPYKGRLKLLNAVVTKMGEGYGNMYRGIVEVELVDADKDFFRKYAASYAAWTEQNNFYYSAKKQVWFPLSAWSENAYDEYNSTAASSAATCVAKTFWFRNLDTIVYLLCMAVFLAAVVFAARRANRRVWDNHAKALAEQQRGLKMVEESLKHQHEHTRLLTEILQALKK